MLLGRQGRIYRRCVGDESGSLIVVMAILIVVALISVAVVNRVQGDFSNVNFQTNMEQARALAQSGVADAQFQIDQRDDDPATFCNAPSPYTCTFMSVPQEPASGDIEYTATYYSTGSPSSCTSGLACYVIDSKGTYRGVTYAVTATVSVDPVIQEALAGATVTFNGNSSASFAVTGSNGLPIAGDTAYVAAASGTAGNPNSLTCHGPGSGTAVYLVS
jgi:Tfp pilus assembly protein PilX